MSNSSDSESPAQGKGRARTRAIRAQMAAAGESWTTAARNHDATRAEVGSDTFDASSNEDLLPYRVVDWHNQGWHGGSDPVAGTRYTADYGWKRDLPDRTYPELIASRGPLRPVLPITDADAAQLRDLFTTAGRRTVTTLAAALEHVFHELRVSKEGATGASGWDYAKLTMTAGREGSWESEALIQVVLFGNGLNLAKPAGVRPRGLLDDIAARRAAGPSKRVDRDVRGALVAMFTRWVTEPGRYTEVAETLAWQVSQYCDDTAGPEGWRVVADQWLQPGGMAITDFHNCYRLFYSVSEHFNAGLL
jgi:hypothetical protein